MKPNTSRAAARTCFVTTILLALVCLVWSASWTPLRAQSYAIASSIIASGGGTSDGTGAAGTFTITGSIAQPAAHASSSGPSFSVSGGFFSQYIALQQAGAPRLIVRQTGANAEIVWGSNIPGWVLQQNTADLSPTGWADVAGPPSTNGNEQFHTFALGIGRVFFRLRKL